MEQHMRHVGKTPQALAISNSSALFVEPWEEPALGRYMIGLIDKPRPVVCHVGAANGDSTEKAAKFFALSNRIGFEPRHLNLFALEDDNPRSFFEGGDAIYIDGGSTRNLSALMLEWRVDQALADAYRSGVPVIGASAGANILFEWGMTDSVRTRITPFRGLGLIPGTISVHANVRADRRTAFEQHLAGVDAAYPAFSLDDGSALHFVDGQLATAVSVRDEALVWEHPATGLDPNSVPCRELTANGDAAV